MSNVPSSLVVFHLVFQPFGLQPFAKFVQSYRRHDSGRAHRLVLLFKGFHAAPTQEYAQLLDGIRHDILAVPDQGLDIATYRYAADKVPAEHYCFFNSRSELLADDWLEKLYAKARDARVGVVSASGSWQSLYSDFPVHHARAQGFSRPRAALRRSFLNRVRHQLYYPPFPNVHVRTNAFLIARRIWQEIRIGRMRSRVATSRFESGAAGLTRQLAAMNLVPLLVGNDGLAYEPPDWPASRTFWQSNQENLLVADNQTARYAQADAAERAFLHEIAWVAPARRGP
jgi:hypothetical protein